MKSTTVIVLIVLILGIVGFFVYNNSSKPIDGNVIVDTNNADAQNIIISMKNGNYYPQTITVKAGQPVSISLDSSVVGCYRSFNIKQLGVSKYLKTPSDTVIFTPKEKGTYRFACSMGMGTGTLIVE